MIDQDEKLTVTLTAAQWSALQSKIMDAAFHAAVEVNNQLKQQQTQLEVQQSRSANLKARLREVSD